MIAEAGPTDSKVLYFAYGSNMSIARLRARAPTCRQIGVASLPDHELRFHKRSRDGSGKCDAFRIQGGAGVFGVIFSFDVGDRASLNRFEGLGSGYDETFVTAQDADGGSWQVLTYTANPNYIDESLKPYSWYRDLVLAGAFEHGLPERYVAAEIGTIEAIEDPDRRRDAKERVALEP